MTMRSVSALVTIAAALLLTSGCGGGGGGGDRAVSRTTKAEQRSVHSLQQENRFAHGLPPRSPKTATAPPAPDTLAALALTSIQSVVGVHNISAAVGRPLGLPAGSLRLQALDIRA